VIVAPAAMRSGFRILDVGPEGSSRRRMMPVQIYLPIADLPVNVFVVFAMGLAVGFISGMFGIGGGFLMTPLLIFLGVPPAVSVATVSSHIAASSFSGAISYWRRRAVDLSLAAMLLLGGFVGTAAGVALFTYLRALGQLDLTISLSYVILLGSVGSLMVAEAVRAIMRGRSGKPVDLRRPGSHTWMHGLPLKARFVRSSPSWPKSCTGSGRGSGSPVRCGRQPTSSTRRRRPAEAGPAG